MRLFILVLLVCTGCATISKQAVKVSVTDTPEKARSEVVTASYEIELK
jgi:uncharacterized protein YceK